METKFLLKVQEHPVEVKVRLKKAVGSIDPILRLTAVYWKNSRIEARMR